MRTATLGSLEVSVVGLGCNNFGRGLDQAGADTVVAAALDAGINFFDTASNYGEGQSERMLGNALSRRRNDVVIATKFAMGAPGFPELEGAHPDAVRASVQRSLNELGTDRIDLLQLHVPDPTTPIADTLGALGDLIDQGKIIEIGCSNLSADQCEAAFAASRDLDVPRFVSNQIEYSIIHRDPEANGLTATAAAAGMALLPFYPLANGLLTGKKRKGEPVEGRLNMDRYEQYLTDRNFAAVEAVRGFAAERNITMAALSIAWLLAQPTVPSVTPGATRPAQITSNVEAANATLADSDLAELDRLLDELVPDSS